MMKLLGAVLIIVGCGGVGFSVSQSRKRLEQAMGQMVACLEWMAWELNERMPPLSVLCRDAAAISNGVVSQVFLNLAQELEAQITPDASACMGAALASVPKLPQSIEERFQSLGRSFGQFDLQGQIAQLDSCAAVCKRDLEMLGRNRQLHGRNYQTLGICAGVALVILFL